jgi:hypothetical protein
MADKKKGSALGTLLKLGVGFVVLVGIVALGGAAMMPSEFSYARSTTIKADRDDVHEWVGDLRKWDDWGPWKEEYPDMKYTYSEKTTEAGSWQSWTGGGGEGKIEFTKVSDKEGVEYKMWFDGDEAGVGGIRYDDMEDGVKATWWWKGDASWPVERWIHKLMSGMIDDMFDKGLTKLKSKAEAKK